MKYPALHPEVNLKSRAEEIADIASYANKLSEADKEWLNAFSNEYICSNFDHKGPKLHVTKEEKKLCYDRNNARNRCIQTRETMMQDMVSLDELRETEILQNTIEDEFQEERFGHIDNQVKSLNGTNTTRSDHPDNIKD